MKEDLDRSDGCIESLVEWGVSTTQDALESEIAVDAEGALCVWFWEPTELPTLYADTSPARSAPGLLVESFGDPTKGPEKRD